MNLVYADQDGQVYDHPNHMALARSGDMIVEILEEELIPLPEGATLVSLPHTTPVYWDEKSGKMKALEGSYEAVGALLPQGFTRLLLPGYVKKIRTVNFPYLDIQRWYGRMTDFM